MEVEEPSPPIPDASSDNNGNGLVTSSEIKNEPPKPEENEKVFKKPILFGKIGRLPKKLSQPKQKSPATSTVIVSAKTSPEEIKRTGTATTETETETGTKTIKLEGGDKAQSNENKVQDWMEQCKNDSEAELIAFIDATKRKKEHKLSQYTQLYKEPDWSGLPESHDVRYTLEVLKSGAIIQTIDLMEKPYWIFGRFDICDVNMRHHTISRYHAVLQYRAKAEGESMPGFYVYDLKSTHGTFLNKNRVKPEQYIKVHVGHMLKFGCSSRTYLLTGPEGDTEEESELSVTELKQKRVEDARRLVEEKERRQKELEELERREEERGVDWGMGDDADEETDLTENPYAQTNNEELYLDDPKKALRGFFEREGFDLEYDCNEQGMGQFLCKVELPYDDDKGRPLVAEVLHKGKKKEAVIQCALEACRMLDRLGLLRQAVHESRKRKAKNWEENDYYDSDDDTFLDRTGTIEKKREKRMQSKVTPKVETYESLMEKEKELGEEIQKLENRLRETQKNSSDKSEADNEADSLDSYMAELKQSKTDKSSVSKIKSDLIKLKTEHANVIKLINIARPASLPPLVADSTTKPSTSSTNNKTPSSNNSLPIFGKRRKIQVNIPSRSHEIENINGDDDDNAEEEEEEDDEGEKSRTDESKNGSSSLSREVGGAEAVSTTDEEVQVVREVDAISSGNEETGVLKADDEDDADLQEKKRKKNQRRIQQRQEKAEMEKLRGYKEDASKEDYNMWVPPSGQSGDGKTYLNDKYGY